LAIFAAYGLSGLASGANAQSTWVENGTGDWFDPANWSGGVPNAGTFTTIIANGGTAFIAGPPDADAGSFVAGATLTIGGGSTLDLQSGGRLLFEKLVLAEGGTFQAANDDWGTGCTAPCVTMAGGTLLGNAIGGNVYFNGFTFAANTTSTITSINFFALSPTAGGTFPAGHVYDFQDGAVVQFGGLVTYSGGAQVTTTGTTGIVILSGGTLQSTALQLGSGGGIGQLTGSVTTTTVQAGGTLDFNDISGAINDLQGAGTVLTGASGATVISIGGGNFAGSINGAGNVVFDGGATTLSGTNGYIGATTITPSASLIVNGSIVSSATVNGTLGGIGSTGDIAVSGTGTVAPGTAPGAIGQLDTGAATFGAGSTYAADFNVATGEADRIDVAGNASLNDAIVAANVINPLGPSRDFTLLHATGTLTNNGAALSGVSNSLVVTYSLSTTTQDLILSVDVDFSPSGADLNPNQTAIGNSLNEAVGLGNGGLTPILTALMGLPTADLYRNALDQLSPEIYSYQKMETLFAAEQFSSDLMSCRVEDGGFAFIREGQCIWVRARGRELDLETTRNNIGSESTVGSFSGGAQLALASNWKLGLAAGYDHVSIDTGTGASADGDRANVGAVLKYNPGPFLLAASASGGWSSFDTTRPMAFGGFAGTAEGNSDIDHVSGRLHAAYLINQGGWYLKPQVDGSVTYIDQHGLTEAGGGGAALSVAGSTDTLYSVSPALEVGSEFRISDLSVLRPFVRVGVTWRDGDSLDLGAEFLEAPAGTTPFTIFTALDDVLADVSAGFDLINNQGAALRLQYDGRFGEETAQNSASIKGSVPF
jgi:uncharacterized protein with beta-barrel porin domain